MAARLKPFIAQLAADDAHYWCCPDLWELGEPSSIVTSSKVPGSYLAANRELAV
jgi:hypothetical protein